MPLNDSPTPPEIDLLARLAGGEVTLTAALSLFPRVDRAKKAVEACVRTGAAEMFFERDGVEAVVQPWRIRFVLNDPGTWSNPAHGTVYHIRLTAGAYERFIADSQALAEDLFFQR